MDRTREFLQCARDSAGTIPSSSTSAAKVKSRSAFQDAAGEIARGVHRTTQTLNKLSKLVQRQGLFDDPTEEINALIFRVKQELGELNSKCDSAQQYVDGQKASRGDTGGMGQGAHHGKVVSQLKSGLLVATKDFKSVLEERSSKMKNQQTRKHELTGGGLLASPMKVKERQAAQQADVQARRNPVQAMQAGNVGEEEMAKAERVASQGQGQGQGYGRGKYALPYGAPMDPGIDYDLEGQTGTGDSGDSTDLYSPNYVAGQESEMQMLLAPPTQYFEARERAVNEVESTIVELGSLFKRLTTMIQEQGEMVERIDEDIENAVSTVDSAADVLKKAYDAASSNTTLYAKLGTILALFIIFFTVFLM